MVHFLDNQYIQQRIEKSSQMREMGKNPYDNLCKRSIHNHAFLDKFAHIQKRPQGEQTLPQEIESVVGRIRFSRLMGKAAFIKIEDDSGILQAYLSSNDLGEDFNYFKKMAEVGDIVAISGFPFCTKTGELSIHAIEFKILTKAIIPLPEKYHGLVDVELRYRQRYLDLIMNQEVKNVFRTRSAIISLIRKFFEERSFLEVETPMMHPISGGANAKPFITHHNALGVDRFLRIAPELYLKRLIVGGFEAIFEINRNFRNEGMDHSHNPEFTMIEFYWAYKNYHELMDLTQDLMCFLVKNLNLPNIIKGDNGNIPLTQFKRITYKEALKTIGQIPADIIEDAHQLYIYLKQHGIKIEENLELGKLQGEAFDAFVEDKLIEPTFITEFPIAISPLARRNDNNSEIADRFELFIDGKEIANGFSELNDPLDQFKRFQLQMEAKVAGDEEAQSMDEDYIQALGYGMPPVAGEGIGIDRLVMLLTQNHSIKDVILFPALKPQKHENQESKGAE
ncbi:lysine--tRNA ligase [Helicobacter monodelphidis]|uniref:lysine--tRNA ligase n=1 Tax=Helicobacter sp. 15-1451 TaxID=2004995 RepID=UPI000DCD0F15|nr:lysine--tRNA ligase [Helicobacter sp. 15-1451]RAX56843.1 lysine--tRNA ligase [Helicobacter sp. 15-1451]